MLSYSGIVADGRRLVVCLSVAVVTSCGGGGNAPVSPSTTCVYTAEPLAFTINEVLTRRTFFQFTVTTRASCGWYAEESARDEDWIIFLSNKYSYGNGIRTFRVHPGDTPAGYPAPRDGEILIYKAVTNEILIRITVAQPR